MDFGDVDAAFPENLCDPVRVQPMAMRFDDLWLVLSQGVHLRLPAVTAAFGVSRDNPLRSRTRRRPRPRIHGRREHVWVTPSDRLVLERAPGQIEVLAPDQMARL